MKDQPAPDEQYQRGSRLDNFDFVGLLDESEDPCKKLRYTFASVPKFGQEQEIGRIYTLLCNKVIKVFHS